MCPHWACRINLAPMCVVLYHQGDMKLCIWTYPLDFRLEREVTVTVPRGAKVVTVKRDPRHMGSNHVLSLVAAVNPSAPKDQALTFRLLKEGEKFAPNTYRYIDSLHATGSQMRHLCQVVPDDEAPDNDYLFQV